MSRQVYITRWKEAASYQHGKGFPHAGGQAGQDVILLVDAPKISACTCHLSKQNLTWQSNL